MENKSYWTNEVEIKIEKADLISETDILIIGAGMTGIMTAYELSKTNSNIVVVDAEKICNGVSSKTTAKVTTMHNLMYQDIKRTQGIKKAKLYYESEQEAVDYIVRTIKDENIDCDLEQVNNYMYATTEDGLNKLLKEYEVLKKIGVNVELIDKLPININIKKSLKCENQYLFHPLKYLAKIVEILKNRNIAIHENYRALKYEYVDKKYTVKFENGEEIIANKVIVATHYPIFNPVGLYFGKLYQEKNYLIAFETNKKIMGEYINTETPVRSLRYHNNVGIMVGNSHIAGDNTDEKTCFEDLKQAVFKFDKNAKIINSWANQDVMTIDFLPIIGQYSSFTPNMYVATSFQTWGMTNSHVAALLISKILNNEISPYKNLYNPSRFAHLKSPVESMKLIGKAVNGLVVSRVTTKKRNLNEVKINSGAIVKIKGSCYAVYRKEAEDIYLKPCCTHTYCFLKWNEEEKTWDCKCHGSRFDIYGKVINGPAVKPLKRVYYDDL